MRRHLNDPVWVQLTDAGRAQLKKNYEKSWGPIPPMLPYEPIFRENAEGWSQWPLWALLKEFGPHVHIGFAEPFFKENLIRLEPP